MGITDRMKSQGMRLGMKAVTKVLESPDRAEKIMDAVGSVQRTQERFEETAQRMLNMGNLPSRDDVKALNRKVGRLRREAKKVLAGLESLERRLDDD